MCSSQCIDAGATPVRPRRTGTSRLQGMLARMAEWDRRARDRRLLAQLETHMLRDIGITREDALREARKPFWQE